MAWLAHLVNHRHQSSGDTRLAFAPGTLGASHDQRADPDRLSVLRPTLLASVAASAPGRSKIVSDIAGHLGRVRDAFKRPTLSLLSRKRASIVLAGSVSRTVPAGGAPRGKVGKIAVAVPQRNECGE
jgi:hypothetical protein